MVAWTKVANFTTIGMATEPCYAKTIGRSGKRNEGIYNHAIKRQFENWTIRNKKTCSVFGLRWKIGKSSKYS